MYMKRRNCFPLLAVTSLLLSCGGSNDNDGATNEYKNPLNDYEEILVKKSALESILSLSSVQSTIKTSQDDEKLYAKNGSKAFTKLEESSSLVSAIYSNKIIVDNEISTSSTTANGIKVTDSHETKSMIAVLKNPEEVLSKGKLSATYGLYQKTFYKASSAKEFGVSYALMDGNFANEDSVDYKWNNYLLNKYDSISSTSFNFFRGEDGVTTALYSSSTRSTVTNPIYRYDSTKNVTSVTSNISSLELKKEGNEYQLKDLHVVKDIDFLSDYFGNSLENGNVYHSETNNSYFYGQSVFAGVPFEANEYWSLNAHTPVLEVSVDNALTNSVTFTNVTRDYQQTYGTDSFAFELTYIPNEDNATYRLTDVSKEGNYLPKDIQVSSAIDFKINEDSSFSLEKNVAYRFLVVLDPNFKLKAISLSLA